MGVAYDYMQMTISLASDALLVERIHLELRERIMTARLPSGAQLSVPALAREFGVSRSPAREAVQQLIADGVATHTPYAGARVALVDDERLAEVFAVRRELDGLAAKLAAAAITDTAMRSLRASLERQRKRLAEPADEIEDRMLDLRFHAVIREASGNSLLGETLERMEVLSHLYRSAMWNDDRNRRFAFDEHERIVEAVDRGDATSARDASQAHVDAVLHRMLRRPA